MPTLALLPSPLHVTHRRHSSLAVPPPPPSPPHPACPFASHQPRISIPKHLLRNSLACQPAVLSGECVVTAAAAAGAGNVWELYEVAEDVLDQLPQGMVDGDGGPIQLPKEVDLFQFPDASPIQLVASVVLLGAITVLLFRSLRRRIRRAKETKLRSFGNESTRMLIVDDNRRLSSQNPKAPEIKVPPASAAQTFVGAFIAGSIAYVLYRFTMTVEESFADKPLSTNYSHNHQRLKLSCDLCICRELHWVNFILPSTFIYL